jgi:flagellum-specific peptidoglycan hydrolase FlgJ
MLNNGFPEWFSAIVVWQACHESGYFSSDLFRRANNLFGMNHPSKRKTKSTGKDAKSLYAVYNSIGDSVDDYIYYLNDRGVVPTALPVSETKNLDMVDKYVSWLKKKGYFTDLELTYRQGVRKASYVYSLKDLKA